MSRPDLFTFNHHMKIAIDQWSRSRFDDEEFEEQVLEIFMQQFGERLNVGGEVIQQLNDELERKNMLIERMAWKLVEPEHV